MEFKPLKFLKPIRKPKGYPLLIALTAYAMKGDEERMLEALFLVNFIAFTDHFNYNGYLSIKNDRAAEKDFTVKG